MAAIDLLFVLISFRITSVVWTQLARINTNPAVSRNTEPTPQEDKIKNFNIIMTAYEAMMNITDEKLHTRVSPLLADKYEGK